MSHTCSSVLVRCIDFRLGKEISNYLNTENLYGDIDIISIAGSTKSISQENNSYAESQVDLSKKLHNINKVILMNHTDCGGYGGKDAFDSKEDELNQHKQDLNIAKNKLQTRHPDIEITLMIADIQEGGGVQIATL